MVQNLGYPANRICLETTLNQLPHLRNVEALPKRRIDIVVFGLDIHPHYPLYPLLLIECKAISLTQKTLRQVAGYNYFVGAHFIGVVNQTKNYLGYYDKEAKDYLFKENFLSYNKLVELAQAKNE